MPWPQTTVQELGFQVILHDQDNQDERLTHTSIPWRNPDLGLNLHSLLCMIKIFESMILFLNKNEYTMMLMDMQMKSQIKS